ncbi:hypothetical protein Bphy_7566 (plasmid) [Paraburkholderia phymatum STM815]|uniref:Uncharacterized protein n=1 Tax=Paraburkholderia phymatum (strain DSM 17167 / CIP 108236 / LMG 21445 / STM815) TaxID=391038 RepID=B2JXZ1_PARP8|nr:hypothetical protein Bphy_7566 [Paraburkholderia phymatum STM815]
MPSRVVHLRTCVNSSAGVIVAFAFGLAAEDECSRHPDASVRRPRVLSKVRFFVLSATWPASDMHGAEGPAKCCACSRITMLAYRVENSARAMKQGIHRPATDGLTADTQRARIDSQALEAKPVCAAVKGHVMVAESGEIAWRRRCACLRYMERAARAYRHMRPAEVPGRQAHDRARRCCSRRC